MVALIVVPYGGVDVMNIITIKTLCSNTKSSTTIHKQNHLQQSADCTAGFWMGLDFDTQEFYVSGAGVDWLKFVLRYNTHSSETISANWPYG